MWSRLNREKPGEGGGDRSKENVSLTDGPEWKEHELFPVLRAGVGEGTRGGMQAQIFRTISHSRPWV